MPVKIRASKASRFDEYRAMQLLRGPDACLLAGVGYLTRGTYEQMPPEEREHALEQMRDDWERHGETLLAWWTGEREIMKFKPWNFIVPEPGERPWAEQRFGAPKPWER